jgi:hypothetical protein
MRFRIVVPILTILVAGGVGCNQHQPLPPTGPSAASSGTGSAGPPVPVSALFAISFYPGAATAGGGSTGTVLLTFPAPAGGLTVNLSSSDPAVVVPPSISIPAGAEGASFQVVTQPVSADRDVTVVASAGGRSVKGTFSVWTVLPVFFSFTSDPDDPLGRGQVRRFTPANATFTAWCFESHVKITIRGATETWFAEFAAPKGAHMSVGSYNNAQPISPAPGFPDSLGPEIGISGNGAGCRATGRFDVRESEMTTSGRVTRFWATFEQTCQGRTGGLRGDVRVLNPEGTSTVLVCR